MKPDVLQDSATFPYPETGQHSPLSSIVFVQDLFQYFHSHLHLSLPSSFSDRFFIKILYATFFSPIRLTLTLDTFHRNAF